MNLFRFILSKDFLKHLVIAAVGIIVLVSSSFIILDIYTNHGDSLPTPNFKKLPLEEARQLAHDHDLHVEVTDSVFQDEWPKASVVKQNPEPGFHVKKGRTIFLTMNASNPEKVKMPNVVGVSHRHAKAILNNSGLKVGKLVHVPDIAVNNVLKQKRNGEEIDPGELIPKGSEIDLVLGKGLSSQMSELPDLTSLTLPKAKSKILESAMNVGVVNYDESVEDPEDSTSAKVWKQYPPYKKNRKIRLGRYIDIWLTVDSTKLPQPDTTQIKYELNAADTL
jgi:beta-lactam-binding protein with PASTA domain